jgi:predicted AAA+ superfamily ATPase
LQELFRLERRAGLQKLMELAFIQSGGIFEAASFAAPCGISRTTVSTYLGILEETLVVQVLRPFHSARSREVVQAPKVYGFDTGFVCHYRGWDRLREEDLGPLWEHLVLNELDACLQGRPIHYWRDKEKHEVDFIWARNRCSNSQRFPSEA